MQVAIISDIHDNLANLDIFLNFIQDQNISVIICAGDLTSFETMKILSNKFHGKIYLVRGNGDFFTERDVFLLKNIIFLDRVGNFELFDRKIGLCHESFLISKCLEKKCDYIFYGHSHKPWIDERNNYKIINPGNLAGVRFRASFALWDFEKNIFNLKILDQI